MAVRCATGVSLLGRSWLLTCGAKLVTRVSTKEKKIVQTGYRLHNSCWKLHIYGEEAAWFLRPTTIPSRTELGIGSGVYLSKSCSV